MKSLFKLLALSSVTQIVSSSFVMVGPNQESTGTPIAVIWTTGSGYEPTQYAKIASEFVS